jgi:3-oxoacyl-[acyl-carrier-protein] synthase II
MTLKRALHNAGITPQDVQAISAAANGGNTLDKIEAAAYAEIFADNKAKPFITSQKGAIGESFSGGAIRACALALSIEKGALPPVVGLSMPLLPLPFVIGKKKDLNIDRALLAGISFGGTYVYLVFAK